MKLLLTSNGLTNETLKKEALSLLQKDPKDCKVAFITTAAYGDSDDISWIEKYRIGLRSAGLSHIVDIDLQNKTLEAVEKLFADKDVLVVSGGNTFFLLEQVRKSGFQNFLEKFLEQEKVYIGISAGSIICCPTIEVASYDLGPDYPPDTNTIGMTDLIGMHFIPFLLSPHIRKEYLPLIEEESKNASLPQVLLTDEQAVLIQGDSVKLVGDGEQIQSSVVNIYKLSK